VDGYCSDSETTRNSNINGLIRHSISMKITVIVCIYSNLGRVNYLNFSTFKVSIVHTLNYNNSTVGG